MVLPIVLCAVLVACMWVLYRRARYWKERVIDNHYGAEYWHEMAQREMQWREVLQTQLEELRAKHRELKGKHDSLIHSLHELAAYQTQWEIDADQEHKKRQVAAFKARVQAEIDRQQAGQQAASFAYPMQQQLGRSN
jgi:hypothetical protein